MCDENSQNTRETLIRQVREALKNAPERQADIARKTKIDQASLSRFKNNSGGLKFENLISLAKYFNIAAPIAIAAPILPGVAIGAGIATAAGAGISAMIESLFADKESADVDTKIKIKMIEYQLENKELKRQLDELKVQISMLQKHNESLQKALDILSSK